MRPSAFLKTIVRHLRDRPVPEPESGDMGMPSLVGNPRFEPLIRRYVASFPELATEVRAHFEADRLDRLRTCVHRVRGTAGNYGYPDLSVAAGECEDRIRGSASREEIAEAVDRLVELLAQITENAR